MLTAFTVENYRAFKRAQRIECRPLTLFFGQNSSGKSALLRFLPLLAESLGRGNTPLYLGGEVGRRAAWADIVCKLTQRPNLKFSLEWANDPVLQSISWDVIGDYENQWRHVQAFQSEMNGVADIHDDVEWEKLLPEINDLQGYFYLSRHLSDFKYNLLWLTGVRASVARHINYDAGDLEDLRSNGSNALLHLIAAHEKDEQHPVVRVVQEFFARLGEQLQFQNPVRGLSQVRLMPLGAQQVSVDLCDTGEGYTQVLPILVALGLAKADGPNLLCLEQPELHLHTRAQAELAQTFVDVANAENPPCLLIETHSEVLLTSLQLALAEGRLKPEQVRVYWVQAQGDGSSDAVAVDFNQKGQPLNPALRHAFEDVAKISRKLMAAQARGA